MPAIEISIYSILIWLSAILIASLDVVIFLGSKNLSSRIFVLLTLLTAIWSAFFGLHLSVNDVNLAVLSVKVEYVLGIFISLGFYVFSKVYPSNVRPSWVSILFLSFLGALISILILGTDLIATGAIWDVAEGTWVWRLHSAIWFYNIIFVSLWVVSLFNIFRKWKSTKSIEDAKNLKYMFFSLTLGIIPPIVLNIIFPAVELLKYGWIGPIASAIWVFLVAYSIIKYRQLNVKVVFAEALVIGMAIIFFLNIFTDLSLGILGRLMIFAAFAFLGYLLVRNIIKVSIQKEELKDLNDNLQKRVDAQTKEIQRAYEVERKARIELERLNQNKNDFIVITQHHLRTPLAQIRWYADSIKNGLYGTVSAELGSAVSRIDSASEKLIKTLNNFLEVVQMKMGAKILDIQPTNLRPILEAVLNELAGEIKEKKLSITFPTDDSSWPLVLADPERMKDVFSILIDNAVRYNQDGGSVEVTTEKKRGIFLFNLSNTGIGLSEDDKERLLKHSFFRSTGAKRAHPTGMGVGLLVAKTIIEAHKGAIKCTSIKSGLMTFEITLPLFG